MLNQEIEQTKESLKNDYEGIFDNLGVLVFKIFLLICTCFFLSFSGVIYQYKIFRDKVLYTRVKGTIFHKILAVIPVLISIVIIYILDKIIAINMIIDWNKPLENFLNHNVVWVLSFVIIFLPFGIVYKKEKQNIYIRLLAVNIIDIKGKTPKLVSYSKYNKDVFHIKFKSIITQKTLNTYKDTFEIYFDKKILDIINLGYNKYKIVLVEESLYRELTKKEDITNDYMKLSLPIEKRLISLFKFFGIDINNVTVTENLVYKQVHFSSSIMISKLDSMIVEFRARLKTRNLNVTISSLEQCNYMFLTQISKTVLFINAIMNHVEEIKKCVIPVILGIDVNGELIIKDWKKEVHSLVIGTTGSGKTNYIHNLLCSILLFTQNVSVFLVDVKEDLTQYQDISNVCRINSDLEKILEMLEILHVEMKKRAVEIGKNKFANNIEHLKNETGIKYPYIVLIIDEYAELLSRCNKTQKEILTDKVKSLCQLGRSLGFKLFLCSQNASKDTFDKIIKTNCPNKLCFSVSSVQDSNNILGNKKGSEIESQGQFYYQRYAKQQLLQGTFIEDNTLKNIINFLENRNNTIEKIENNDIEVKEKQVKTIITKEE